MKAVSTRSPPLSYLPKKGHRPARVAVEEMRPHAVESVRALEETHDLQHALRNRLARDEFSLCGDEHRHDAEAAAAEREQVRIAGQYLGREPGLRMPCFPVVTEATLPAPS